MLGLAREREATGENRLDQPPARRDVDALLVAPRAAAEFGDVELVEHRQAGEARHDAAVAGQRDVDAPQRAAEQEVGGAVERIDDPGVATVAALERPAFLAQEAVFRPRRRQHPADAALSLDRKSKRMNSSN